MRIGGFQKLTLLDFPGRVSAIIFTRGCNFKCPYCHNPEMVLGKCREFSQDEVLNYLKKKRFFLDGLVISGGEPTLQPHLVDFIRKVKALGMQVKLDTNGSYPMVLKTLFAEGLVDYVAMDIKAGWDNYEKISKCRGIEGNCRKSIELIRKSGVEYEFRTTVYPPVNDAADKAAIKAQLLPGEKYTEQKMRTGNCLDPKLNAEPQETMELRLEEQQRALKTVELPRGGAISPAARETVELKLDRIIDGFAPDTVELQRAG